MRGAQRFEIWVHELGAQNCTGFCVQFKKTEEELEKVVEAKTADEATLATDDASSG